MSRTDKDTPWWVAAELWEPYHYRCEAARSGWAGMSRERDCDLPAEPIISAYRTPRRGLRACLWVPVWAPFRNQRRHGQPPPPRWFVDHVWNAPSRRAVRDDCREAAKEYRGTGEIDVVPPTTQHRHCAAWLYW